MGRGQARTWAILSALVVATITFEVARAQPEASSADDEARQLFEAGNTAYDSGRFRNAYDSFVRAYELSRRPVLLFNIGRAADLARMDREAIDAYERFLTETPEEQVAPRRDLVEERLRTLRANLGADRPPDADPPPRASGSGDGMLVPGIALVAGGGAVLAAGVVMLGVMASDLSSVESAPRGTSFADVSDAYYRTEPLSIAGFVSLGVGAALAITGVVLIAMPAPGGAESVALRVGPSSLALEGSFR